MRKIASAVVAAALVLMSAVAPAPLAAQPAAAKLGFLFSIPTAQCPFEGQRCSFETRLLVLDGEVLKFALATPHLYVPRSSGFWEVGLVVPKATHAPASQSESQEENAGREPAVPFEWRLWAVPIGKRPSFPKPPSAETEEPSEESTETIHYYTLSWLGTDYLSVTEQLGEYSNTPMVLAIDGIAHSEPAQPWKPQVADETYQKDFENCIDEQSDFNTRSFLGGAEQTWSIARGKMRWELQWGFTYSGGAARGYATGCGTSILPPKELVGGDTLGVGWNQVLARVPDARTAFSSPDHSVVLVFTNTQILALRREGTGLGQPFARVFLPTTEVFSGQWATGRYVDAWAEQLSHAESWTDAAP